MNKMLKVENAIAQIKSQKLASQKTADRDDNTGWRTTHSKRFAPVGYAHSQLAEQPPLRVLSLNHINISASPALIEKVKCFYTDIVGLTVGPRARLDHEGYWLYAGHLPILHLSARVGLVEEGKQKGRLNHVSLGCVGLMGAIAKLRETGTPYKIVNVADTGQTQLFLQDPAGISIELTFFNESVIPTHISPL